MLKLNRRDAGNWLDTAPWIGWMEPITPVLLAAHGALLLRDSRSMPVQWILVAATALLGVAGLAGWRSSTAMKARAWLLVVLAWTLMYVSGGVASFFTLWYFMLAAVYPLVLVGKVSAAYPLLMGFSYLGLLPITESRIAVAVLLGRAAVITATGVVVAGISASQRRSAAELMLAKDEFIASVSHELRTPLTAVVGFAAELHQRAGQFQLAEIEEFAGAVHRQSVEVADIVEDLLVAARADIGGVTVTPVVLDIRDGLDQIVRELQALHGVTADQVTVAGASVVAFVDEIRFRQILRNLFVNALRYGGSRIEARVATSADQASVEIADDGRGVPDADITHLFTPYQRFHPNGGQPGSIGLGLAVSRTLARLMHGELSYCRRDGWSVFRLELPTTADVSVSTSDRLPTRVS